MTALTEQQSAWWRVVLVARDPAGFIRVADDAAWLLARTLTGRGLLLALAHARPIKHGELKRLHLARVHVSVPLRRTGRRIVSRLGRLKPAEVHVMLLAILLSDTITARDDSGDTLRSHGDHIISFEVLIERAVIVQLIIVWAAHRRQVHSTTVVEVLTFTTVCKCLCTSVHLAARALVRHILVPSLIGCCAVTRGPTVTVILNPCCSFRTQCDYLRSTGLGLAKCRCQSLATLLMTCGRRWSSLLVARRLNNIASGLLWILLYVSRGLIRVHSYLITK